MLHPDGRIPLSWEKERSRVGPEIDEPRAFSTGWSKSEREKQVSYVRAYIRNLGRWYWWACLQGNKRDTGRADVWTPWGSRGWDEWGDSTYARPPMLWGIAHTHPETYVLPRVNRQPVGTCCVMQGAQTPCSVTTEGWGGMGADRFKEGRDICMPTADSCWYMAGANTVL